MKCSRSPFDGDDSPPPPFAFPRVRLSRRAFRWTLLTLYSLIVFSFVGYWAIEVIADEGWDGFWPLAIAAGLMFGGQAVMIFTTGVKDLCRPVRRRRLLVPVIIASLMMALLSGAFFMALADLFKLDEDWMGLIFLVLVGVNWVGWGVLFYLYCRNVDRFTVLTRLTLAILTGSLIELLAAIPSHLIVSRRPGCLVGLMTQMAICAGVYVAFWSFGPGIILLFLRERRRDEADAE